MYGRRRVCAEGTIDVDDVEAAKCPVLAALSRAGMARDTVSLCT